VVRIYADEKLTFLKGAWHLKLSLRIVLTLNEAERSRITSEFLGKSGFKIFNALEKFSR